MSGRSLLIEAETYERIQRVATTNGLTPDEQLDLFIRRALGDSVEELERERAEREAYEAADSECPRCGGSLIERDHAMSGCPGGDPGE